MWLPQYAVMVSPVNDVTLYGNYGVAVVSGAAGAVVGG